MLLTKPYVSFLKVSFKLMSSRQLELRFKKKKSKPKNKQNKTTSTESLVHAGPNPEECWKLPYANRRWKRLSTF